MHCEISRSSGLREQPRRPEHRGQERRTSQILGNLVQITRSSEPPIVTHYNIQPVVDVYGCGPKAKISDMLASQLQKVIDGAQKDLPKGSRMVLRGQVQTMKESFAGFIGGLVFAMLPGLSVNGREFPILGSTR